MKGLTEKQIRFVEAMLIEPDAKAAYIKAGYSARGSAAEVNASRLLRNAKVKAALKELRQQRSIRTEITADRVLQEIAAISFSRITDVVSFDADGVDFKNSDELDDKAKAAIASVTYSNSQNGGIRQSAKMHDKIAALTLLCKHLGIAEGKEENGSDQQPVINIHLPDQAAG